MQEIALGIQTYYLASCPEARVDSQSTFLPHRGRQQELAQVLPENLHGFYIGLLLGLSHHLVGYGRLQQAFIGIIYRFVYLLCKRGCRVPALLTEIIVQLLSGYLRS